MHEGNLPPSDWKIALKMRFHELIDRLQLKQESITNIILYGGIGFLSGFLCKKSSSYVVAAFFMIMLLFLLQQYDVISIVINWHEMSRLLGIQPISMTGDTFFALIWESISANLAISIAFACGFIFGFKLG